MFRIHEAVDELVKQNGGYAFATGFLIGQLIDAVALLPKTKQKEFISTFDRLVGYSVKVTVKHFMTGVNVELPWNEVGSATDPSTERYWSA